MSRWQRIARDAEGTAYATAYAERFRAMVAAGQDVHGEAGLVTGLAGPPPARVLDAGCGTGRIATHLAGLGYDVVGVDVDASMVRVAQEEAPSLDWRVVDLATMALDTVFDLVLVAGNVVPLLEPGTLDAVAARLAAHTDDGGLVVCGFGLDADHLPGDCPVTPLADVDSAFARVGLEPVERWSTWDRGPWVEGGGYVVTLHRRAPRGGSA
ncbi:methyltransferase domain-containing protein [Nocardioides sp.]|uniref:class I SAM-dependent methyltransferase n=1 Tax=Nocardioides sp. TaxID=35761 RepID=UPI00286C6A48|nr:methyltransferase domain-containing protein [Nocardioides sp.]